MPKKIISWNVNGLRACSKQGLAAFVREQEADIVCLQEIKAMEGQCAELISEFSGWTPVWHSAERPGYSGVLTFYKEKPREVRVGCGAKNFDCEGRVLVTDHGDFFLVNLYFPNGGSGPIRHEFKMKFLEHILNFFKTLDREKPIVATGDFNIAHKEIDIHDPVRLDGTSGFMPVERDWMDDLVKAGFSDSFRHFQPEARDQYSWWSYRQGSRRRNKGWRIDYFFVSERFKDRLKSSQMLPDVRGSDHCPLILEIE